MDVWQRKGGGVSAIGLARVAIYPVPNQLPKERTVIGTREDAEATARSMINAWLKKTNRPDTTKH
jgi:hypothetical protein